MNLQNTHAAHAFQYQKNEQPNQKESEDLNRYFSKEDIQMAGLVTKSCPTLETPWARKVPGSSVHGILQAKILEWVAISSPYRWLINTKENA